MNEDTTMPVAKPKANGLTVSWRLLAIVLLIIIAVMLAIWRPWQAGTSAGRTITVTGEATVSAEPDELVFYPSFTIATTQDLAARANELTAGLKALGVEDKAIRTNASAYEKYYDLTRLPGSAPEEEITLQFTITLNDKELAQKVQDYLVSQKASGQITPQGSFSDEKRKQLQDEATEKAAADARTRAEKMAANLGAGIGKVVKVSESQGYGIYPMENGIRDMVASSADASMPINQGENDFTYQLQAEYELK